MEHGTVKYFNSEKGYGFIQPDFGDDAFFHISNVDEDVDELPKGARVRYEIGEGRRAGTTQAIHINIEGTK